MRSGIRPSVLFAALAWACLSGASPLAAAIQVSPVRIDLSSPESAQQLQIQAPGAEGRLVDLTRTATVSISDPKIASIDDLGLVQPRGDGRTEIVVRHGADTVTIPVTVSGLERPRPVSFIDEVIPILSKARCSSGGCHGKAEGKAGFKLTVFGFDPKADHESLAKESRGRRIVIAAPDQSLFLRKAAALAPHGGGRRIVPNDSAFRLLRRWVAEGARFHAPQGRAVQAIRVEPKAVSLLAGHPLQLRVSATDANGEERCVTVQAEYESNAASIAEADERGFVQAGKIPGEAAILVRYMGHVDVCRVTIPRPGVEFPRPAETNFIDGLVWDNLQRLGIEPSGLAEDGPFLRRVYLDVIGTLPTADEAREFLASKDPDKRVRLIDRLLQRDEYATYWAMLWSDILRVDKQTLTSQGAVAVTRWLRRQFAENRPYDEIVREILTAEGSLVAEGPAPLYKAFDKPETLGKSISQLFLGVRIDCAQCHHHPFEKWGQADYYGFAGFFTGVSRKKVPGAGEVIVANLGSDLKHPRTGEPTPAKAFDAPAADFADRTDRRAELADWMSARENPFFARAIANRIWAHYFGRGLVDPVDDMRATNPATNEPLLAALSEHLHEVDFDLKAFTRTVLNSRAYQASATTTESNATDQRCFSHAMPKVAPAEVLLDAICQVTGVPEKFNGWPEGYRAIEIWDNRMPSYFFRVFGRPTRLTVCECERSGEPSISQALHLLNSPEIDGKVRARNGRARRLADSERSAEEIVTELYLGALSRFPSDEESALMLALFARTDRKAATEDALWVLLNSKEFIYCH